MAADGGESHTPKSRVTTGSHEDLEAREAAFVEDYVMQATRDVDEWEYARVDKAIKRSHAAKFNEGRAPICATTIRDISNMGAGTALHLELQRSLFVVMSVMTVLALPALVVAYSGERVAQTDRDALYIAQTSVANVGLPPGAAVGNDTASAPTLALVGLAPPIEDQALIFSLSDLACTLLFLYFINWFRARIDDVVDSTDAGNVTPADYAIMVRKLPKDATEREIVEHFDKLYSLWDEDWTFGGYWCGLCSRKGPRKRRPQFKPETEATLEEAAAEALDRNDRFQWTAVGRTTANPVTDPRNNPPRMRALYTSKWVAEVSVAHPNGSLIRRFQQLKKTSEKLDKAVEAAAHLKHLGRTAAHEAAVKQVEALAKRVFQANSRSTDKLSVDAVAAFVTFENEESHRRCVADAEEYSGGCCGAPRPLRFRRESELEIRDAPEPTDVVWENLEVTDEERTRRTIAVGCIVLVLLLLSTAIVIFFQRAKAQAQEGVPDVSICSTALPIALYGEGALVPNGWTFERDKEREFAALEKRLDQRDAQVDDDFSLATGAHDELEFRSNASAPQCLEGAFHIRLDPPPLFDAWKTRLDADDTPIYVAPFFDASFFVNVSDPEERDLAAFDAFNVAPELKAAAVDLDIGANDTVACVNPCVRTEDTKNCPRLDKNTFTRNSVAGCYCLSTFSAKVDTLGLQGAINFISDQEADICLPIIQAYSFGQALAVGAAVLVVAINQLLQAVLAVLTKFEKHNSVSDEQSALAYKIFVGQLINTAFIVLVVNAEFAFISEANLPPEIETLFVGEFSGFKPRWFTVVGVAIALTMLTNVVVPHLWPLTRACCVSPCQRMLHRRAIRQEDLDKVYAPPEFVVATRYPVILNNMFVTILYSAGMPLLIPISAIGFLISYFVDKYMLLRFYARPRGTNASLARLALQIMPVALLLHLCFAIYMLGDPDTLPSYPFSVAPVLGPGAQAAYQGIIASIAAVDPVDAVIRINRANTMGHFALLVILVVGTILYLTAGRVLYAVLRAIVFVCTCGRRGQAEVEEELNPPYTGAFYQPISEEDAAQIGDDSGWALRPDPYRGGDNLLRVKLWAEAAESQGRYFEAGDEKATWEVIKEAGLHSYRIETNPAYSSAVRVMLKTLRSLGIDLEAHELSLPEKAVVAESRRGNLDVGTAIHPQPDEIIEGELKGAEKYAAP